MVRGLLAVFALYVVCTLVVRRPPGDGEVVWLDVWFDTALRLASGLVAMAGAARCRFDRPGWWISGVAIVTTALGDISWLLLFDGAVLSPSDALFLAYYPMMYVSVLLLARSRAATRGVGQWLDGAVAGLGSAAVGAVFVFPSLLAGAEGSTLAVAVNLSYPVADLLLLAVLMAGLAPVGWRPDRALTLLIVGLLAVTVADVVYLLEPAEGSHYASLVNLLWVTSVVVSAVAPFTATRMPAPVPATNSVALLLLPSLSALAALTMLVVAARRPVPAVAVVLATGTLVAVGVRLWFAFKELRMLALTRIEARTDELTRLPNRRAFLELVEQSLGGLDQGRPCSLLLVDLDGFKEVNDTLGHQAGDSLLTSVARVLSDALRPTDHVARLGGDEFAVILDDTDLLGAHTAAHKLLAALATPIQVANMAIVVGASIGISTAPLHAADPATLMRFADIAMYRAKQSRNGGGGLRGGRRHIQPGPPGAGPADPHRPAPGPDRAPLPAQGGPDPQPGDGYRGSGAMEPSGAGPHLSRHVPSPWWSRPACSMTSPGWCSRRRWPSWPTGWPGVSVWTAAVNIAPTDLLDESLPNFVAELLARHDVPSSSGWCWRSPRAHWWPIRCGRPGPCAGCGTPAPRSRSTTSVSASPPWSTSAPCSSTS